MNDERENDLAYWTSYYGEANASHIVAVIEAREQALKHDHEILTKTIVDTKNAEMKALVERVRIPIKDFVELYQKHCAYEEARTKMLQEAANLSRQCRYNEANKMLRGCDNDIRVFDYSKVNKGLVNLLSILDEIKKG